MGRTNVMQGRGTTIVATGPAGFPGAGQAMAQTLREFAEMGCDVMYIGAQRPFLFNFLDTGGVRFCLPSCLQGGVISEDGAVRSPDVLLASRLAEAMIRCVEEGTRLGSTPVLWGSYLFPYGLAAMLARTVLMQRGQRATLWVTPTGSDVWEIGPQLQNVTEWLLNSPLVDAITAYTERFAAEIVFRYGVRRPVKIIPPSLDWRRFERLDCTARSSARQLLNVPGDAFIIVCHSNMRPVKRPEAVIAIADLFARRVSRPILLLMIGPVREDLLCASADAACDVRWLGVQERIEELIVAGDVELNCSTHDSYNLSLAEAMCCGVPVITTDVVGIAPEIIAACAGHVFPAHLDSFRRTEDPHSDSLISFLVRLSEDEDERVVIGARAREWASATFRTRSAAAEFMKIV